MEKALGVINKVRFYAPRRTLNMLYNAMRVSYISYCNVVWAGTYRTITDPIRLIMKRALRLVTSSTKQSHTLPLFLSTKNLNFDQVSVYFTANFVYKQLTNKLPSKYKIITTLAATTRDKITLDQIHQKQTFSSSMYIARDQEFGICY
ncbi:hypothetical protein HELRODRAFT_164906 [Helobdella robusta]|uniref:Reverse transcriptase domain-containing protein n=1 Tax=Helobdella robusta TaxID=6412 RepID=T1EVY4_HELRO|nr:hypothetical protein HELRODRAFT_164906 [Helobdella robusta]ESN92790.1 hypothetical protein HELRODRAFT_164906 [Helobdella robusta]